MSQKINLSRIIKNAGMFTSKVMHLEQGQTPQDIINGEKGVYFTQNMIAGALMSYHDQLAAVLKEKGIDIGDVFEP